ncbi:LysM peptidoglycan-binding domain-containing protein [Nakamurella antarctica]|nr:LysM peptidoglycan-binding domain-containing protein [Nakamurella antarctica]
MGREEDGAAMNGQVASRQEQDESGQMMSEQGRSDRGIRWQRLRDVRVSSYAVGGGRSPARSSLLELEGGSWVGASMEQGTATSLPIAPTRRRARTVGTRRPPIAPIATAFERSTISGSRGCARQATSDSGYRMSQWARLSITISVAATGVLLLLGGFGPSAHLPTEQLTVAPGQSLWTIAQTVAPDVDPRITVNQIMDINGMDSEVLAAGEVLLVPVAG